MRVNIMPNRSARFSPLAGLPLLVCLSATCAYGQPRTIHPGDVWPDDRGQHVQSHGGGIVKFKDTYYWFGEDRAQNQDRSKRFVGCYASKDLSTWTFRNQVNRSLEA